MRESDTVTVVRADETNADTAQTKGMPRLAGVGPETTDASSIWMGQVTGEPGMDSGPHHHGKAETAGYVLSGQTRILYGENYQRSVELGPGDFIYIPPYVPHIERNLDETEPVEFLTARSPDNIVVNLSDEPDI